MLLLNRSVGWSYAGPNDFTETTADGTHSSVSDTFAQH
uniref:Uncharacterized protein n=1 Tax=Anguilla anguilla TaxID=7936 RepID=A0A0E9VB55_ANGAN